jgi:Arc/MetJ family transcription regulator
MRTAVNIDDKLMSDIMKCTGVKNKTKIINKALADYLGKLNRESIMDAYGKFDSDLDVKEFRNLELQEV